MKIVCIGIGGTGAACVEVITHLAALGLFPPDTLIVPAIVDPDRGHPRITGLTNFLTAYTDLRVTAEGSDLSDGGFWGARLVRDKKVNSLRPAQQESLYTLLGFASPKVRPLSRLFFEKQEIGEPDGREFANGYYGRANAGVCFFSDPAGKATVMDAVRQYLLGGDSIAVVVGSIFGGTGAAGLLNVARSIRTDPELRDQPPRLAVIQLESYFQPDATKAGEQSGFVNLPATFQRRTGAAYEFLADLSRNNNLPFDALYPIGTRTPTIFPPSWFKKDQQDNPHLFVEYLAALAARDFVLNPPASVPDLRLRRAPGQQFGPPLDLLENALHDAAITHKLLTQFVAPLLKGSGGTTLPGHPWIHDLIAESGVSHNRLVDHLERSTALLTEILGHAGVIGSGWRKSVNASEATNERYDLMTELTRKSFPDTLLPFYERLDPASLLAGADPLQMFATYDKGTDALMYTRALARWVAASKELPAIEVLAGVPGATEYQLVQQEDLPDRDGQVLSLAVLNDDSFRSVDTAETLKKLARATWKSPDPVPRHRAEYPSVWATALVYPQQLRRNVDDRTKYIHLGLLSIALLKLNKFDSVPVFEYSLQNTEIATALRDSIRSTCPISNYDVAVTEGGGILALYDRERPLTTGEAPDEEDIIGFFYPDTVVVPAAGMSKEKADRLYDLGKYVAAQGFGTLIKERFADWQAVLKQSSVPEAEVKGPVFEDFIKSFGPPRGQTLQRGDLYETFPISSAAPWIHHLYVKGDQP